MILADENIVSVIVDMREWVDVRREEALEDAKEQARILEAASRWIGATAGSDPNRSTQVRARVRDRLEARRAR